MYSRNSGPSSPKIASSPRLYPVFSYFPVPAIHPTAQGSNKFYYTLLIHHAEYSQERNCQHLWDLVPAKRVKPWKLSLWQLLLLLQSHGVYSLCSNLPLKAWRHIGIGQSHWLLWKDGTRSSVVSHSINECALNARPNGHVTDSLPKSMAEPLDTCQASWKRAPSPLCHILPNHGCVALQEYRLSKRRVDETAALSSLGEAAEGVGEARRAAGHRIWTPMDDSRYFPVYSEPDA